MGEDNVSEQKPIRIFQVIVLVTVLVAANAFLGYSLAKEAQRAMTEQIQSRMLDLARSSAALLDGDRIETITAADMSIPAYKQAYKTLEAFQDNMDVTYIYLIRNNGGESYQYIVDPADDPAEYGEAPVYTKAMSDAAKGAPSIELDAVEDRWGRFYTAYCPVFDSKGNVAGIVGVDFEAEWYESHAANLDRMAIINTIASLILALVAVVLVAKMTRSESRHVQNLLKAGRFDKLTGLPNMSFFLEHALDTYKEMVDKGESPAMLYIDLVGMKFFNQRHGYAEGDKLLVVFSELLAKHFGLMKCSRFGQDHFAVSTNSDNLEARLDAFIAENALINNGNSLPVSIGIHLESLDNRIGVSAACDRAKTACENNKDEIHSRYCYYDSSMMAQIEQRQYIIDNIDRAIDEGWIHVHYQPIVRASTGRVCDEEALARWVDPKRGTISPAEFVPVLEDVRLAYKLDLNVLEQTLAKMHRLSDAGLHVVTASVNLSRSDFEVCDIVEEVRMRVDKSGFGRDKITIEITETAMGSDFEYMRKQVERFHELGFQVWMDDFGSEYSSLDYLQNMHFDLLKFDLRFMQQFEEDRVRSKVILTELVKLALALGVDTVVEGVETQEQVEFLRKIGCSKLQGYYFSRPNSEEEIMERYAKGSAIGFENPAEAEYYSALGRTNLYDFSSIARRDEPGLEHYFDTLPMAVIECADEGFVILRCNRAYYRFIKTTIGDERVGELIQYALVDPENNNPFIQAVRECGKNGGRLSVEERMSDNKVVHSFVRRIAENPVTGAAGLAVAVLSIESE